MENSPLYYEEDEDEESSTKDNKKTRLGLFALSNETPDKEKDEGSWFSRLTEKEPDEKEKPKEEEKKDEAEDEPKPKLELVETTEEQPVVAEVEPASETEAPLEEPSQTEVEEVVRPKLVEVIEEIEADQEADPVTDPPIDKFRDLVKSGEEPDAAFDEVMEEMGIEESEVAELDPETSEEVAVDENAEAEPEIEAEDGMNEIEELEAEPDIDEEPEAIEAIEIEQEMQEDEPEDPDLAASSDSPSTPPPGQPTPPTQNTPPAPPQSPPPAGFQPPPFGPQPPGLNTPNTLPPTPNQNQNAEPAVPEYHQASPAAMALFGGIIGYLIGRRHGRIKTEKQLLPVQKKLEKQVEGMQFELQEKEKKIRRIAAAKVEKDGPQVIESFKKKQKVKNESQQEIEQNQTSENLTLQSHQAKHEHIGHMMVKAESKPEESPEALRRGMFDKTIDAEVSKNINQKLATMSRTELLAMSEKIIIDGSSLRQIFETHLIGERGLRRLIAEQMRGGDLKKALQMEIVEREIDFEQDPRARNVQPPQSVNSPVDISGGNAALSKMLEKASASIGGNEEAAFIRARAAYEAEQTNRQLKQRRVIDVSFAVIISVLIATVIYLIISRM